MIFAVIGFYITKFKLQMDKTGVIIATIGTPIVLLVLLDMILNNIHLFLRLLLLAIVVFAGYKYFIDNKTLRSWKNKSFDSINTNQYVTILENAVNRTDDTGISFNVEAASDDIPTNRADYFSKGSKLETDQKEIFPIFYDFAPTSVDPQLQEYGYLVTSVEVIIKQQIKVKDKINKKHYECKSTYLPFQNVYQVERRKKELTIFYDKRKNETVNLDSERTAVFLQRVFQASIDSGWTKNCEEEMHKCAQEEREEIDQRANQALKNVEVKNNNQSFVNTTNANAGINMQNDIKLNQLNDRFGGGQGHGHVGEQYGDAFDGLKHWNAKRLGGTHEKYGADRLVNHVNIQTKYNSSARRSVGQIFGSDGTAKYVNPDGSMMVVEVPKDQYGAAVREMSKKIKNGQVPNENPANADKNAAKYVKKGAITYDHARIATKSIFDRNSTINVVDKNGNVVHNPDGTIKQRNVSFGDKMVYSFGGDFVTGVKSTMPMAFVVGVWVFCNNMWNGKSVEESLKNSAITMFKVGGTGGVMYALSSQIGGSDTLKKMINKQLVKHGRDEIKHEVIASKTMGVLTIVVTEGPDVVNCLMGKISMKQLIKNSVANIGGVFGGAAVGSLAGSIVPGIGNVVGGAIGGIAGYAESKKVMDKFVEDDAVTMTKILKEEFINVILYSPLNPDEFKCVMDDIFNDKKTPKLLQDMYVSKKPRKYIHDKLEDLVINLFEQRPIDENLIINSFKNSNDEYVSA